MRKVLLAVGAALALASCATQGELRANGDGLRLASGRAPAAVRDCLVTELADVRQFGLPLAPPTVSARQGGWTLSYDNRAGRVFIDVLPREGGSSVAYHPGLPMDVPARVGDLVRSCSGAA